MNDSAELSHLLAQLESYPQETEWIEFKQNYADPNDIGEYISAIANSATLHRQEVGLVVWGIDDKSHQLVGTSFEPRRAKVGNEELENWLNRLLLPRIHFRIRELDLDTGRVVVFEVPPATHTPVRFSGVEYIRIGTCKQRLKDFPEKERELWRTLSATPFEKGVAKQNLSGDEVLHFIDYPSYLDLTGQAFPTSKEGILDRLSADRIVVSKGLDLFNITNLGAVLFARDLGAFNGLSRKAVRVVFYRGADRIEANKEQVGTYGYAVGFRGLIAFINDRLPQNEFIREALRHEAPMYPEIAIRELVANAIIHQDFAATGTGPMVEVFSNRVEITNPGIPLIEVQRFLDAPPQSRNEDLASLMRRLHICEERGSGIDKVFHAIEMAQLPAPSFSVTGSHTRAVLFGPRKLSAMSRDDRVRACYFHAALLFVSSQRMTNATLRNRFSISDKNYSMASRIIADTIDAGLIKLADPHSRSRKHASYVPFWA